MADDDAEPAPEPERKPFGGKAAPLFTSKKGGPKKFLDDHKLAVISTLVAIVGLVYLVMHNRASSTSGSTSANVSGQSAAANNAPATDTGTAPSPYQMQPWWTGDNAGGGGGMALPGSPQTGTGTPPAKKSTGAAKAQPSSHPASSPAKPHPAAASTSAPPNVRQVAGLYAPLSPSSSAVHSVAATAHPASHVAVGTSGNGSNVLVPFTYRAGTPAPTAHAPAPHVAAAAKRPAGRRMAGRR